MMWRACFAVILTAVVSLFALSAPHAQFNGCQTGFCNPPHVGGGASVTIDKTGVNQESSGRTAPSFTYTGITGVAGNALVAAFLASGNVAGGTFTTVTATWAAQSMTSLGSISPAGGSGYLQLFYVLNPTAGSQNLVFTVSGGSNNPFGSACAWSFNNATAVNNFQSSFSNSTLTLNNVVTSAVGHYTVGAVGVGFNAVTMNQATDCTSTNGVAGSNNLSWAAGKATGASSVTYTGTQTPTDIMYLVGADVSN